MYRQDWLRFVISCNKRFRQRSERLRSADKNKDNLERSLLSLKKALKEWKREERVAVVGVRVTGLSGLVCVSAQAVAAAGWISFASESASLVEEKMLYWANGGGRAARSPVAKQGKADPKEEGSRAVVRTKDRLNSNKPSLSIRWNVWVRMTSFRTRVYLEKTWLWDRLGKERGKSTKCSIY